VKPSSPHLRGACLVIIEVKINDVPHLLPTAVNHPVVAGQTAADLLSTDVCGPTGCTRHKADKHETVASCQALNNPNGPFPGRAVHDELMSCCHCRACSGSSQHSRHVRPIHLVMLPAAPVAAGTFSSLVYWHYLPLAGAMSSLTQCSCCHNALPAIAATMLQPGWKSMCLWIMSHRNQPNLNVAMLACSGLRRHCPPT